MCMKFLFCALLIISNYISAQVAVVIHSKTGYEGVETFADRSAKVLEGVFNSEKFKNAILHGTFS